MALINTYEHSEQLRKKGFNKENEQILITQFSGSAQSNDLTLPYNCSGYGRVHHFRRESSAGFPENSLPIDPAHHALQLPFENLVRVQVFQNAVCSWRCWYCFVDYNLLSGNLKHAAYLTVEQLLDLYQAEEQPLPIIDLSGGQPDLIPEWILWFTDAVRRRGLVGKVYVWSDDNLSNNYLWEHLSKEEIGRLAEPSLYGRVGCFKGFDPESFSFNTNTYPELFDQQFVIMKRLVESRLDMYGYVTLTAQTADSLQNKMISFMDQIQERIHPNFLLRTIPLPIKTFSPSIPRMASLHHQAISIQQEAVAVWNDELQKRFTAEQRYKRVFEHMIWD
ncbi:hypothetical protein [Spirosoma foliorum]|uniref:Radical SAM core domain-containing protein n=1 Tax=Spirosoma foliorum TaxID=2710596 RepID=A0A7G5H2S4_9BACT|nr:hypothetical protein [Spirosoma foliorum]QMW05416.1 hypothetical protein H3H32_11240 [Spirosoma foliorum]